MHGVQAGSAQQSTCSAVLIPYTFLKRSLGHASLMADRYLRSLR